MAPATPSASTKLPLRHKVGATVTPGDRLGLAASRNKATLVSGKGTYVRQGHLYASVLGTLCATHHDDNADEEQDEEEEGEKWIISIQLESKQSSSSNYNGQPKYSDNATDICPQVGNLILGRITKVIRPSHAMVDIVAIVPDAGSANDDGSNQQLIVPLHEPHSGTLRTNELRPNSSLEIRIEDCLRPSDLILAKVHANGERDFILTTAEAELGVIQAKCESSGCDMRAISWKEMQCPMSGVKEGRKVAKPRQVMVRG